MKFMMASTTSPEHPTAPAYHFDVEMTCSGCSGAVTRVLSKLIVPPQGYYKVDLPKKEVLVWGSGIPPFDTVTEKIAKTGKQIRAKEIVTDQAKLDALFA
ncbi:putative copper chaperone [Naematelia encephala]|uniref:Putative copper chaperone n=1 Tax=Naematelia encephala TaxID=71784 RepID=A0A1Y2BLE5_9TREE|nr:putative copper chaperone [Naematelia encephala]